MFISIDFGAIRSWNCLAAWNRQKIHKKPYFGIQGQWSSKAIEFGGNQEPAYDFLLVINSNLGLSCTVIEIQWLIG